MNIEIPRWLARLCLQVALQKGLNHKYVRRVPTGNPKKPYRYLYTLTSGRGRLDHADFKEGSAFKLADGHVHVTKAEGDYVTVRHDESGETHTMNRHHLAEIIESHHAKEIDAIHHKGQQRSFRFKQRTNALRREREAKLPRGSAAITEAIEGAIAHDFGAVDLADQRVQDTLAPHIPPKKLAKMQKFSEAVAYLVHSVGDRNEVRTWRDLLHGHVGSRGGNGAGATETVFDVLRQIGHEIDDPKLQRASLPQGALDAIAAEDEAEHWREHEGSNDTGFEPEELEAVGMRKSYAELPQWLARPMLALLIKGAGHKYIRRVPTGNPKRPWRYFYRVTGGKGLGHDSELIEGAAFRVKDSGKEGHFHIEKVDGDQVTIKHDESGKAATISREALRSMLHTEHAEAISAARVRAKQNVEDAAKHGSEKQKSRTAEAARKLEEAFGEKAAEEPASGGDVDESLWRRTTKFGVAGGPASAELTTEGRQRAWKVATGLFDPAVLALQALHANGGEVAIERRFGTKISSTGGAKYFPPDVKAALTERGLIEFSPSLSPDKGRAYRLTDRGKLEVQGAQKEEEALLGRVRAQLAREIREDLASNSSPPTKLEEVRTYDGLANAFTRADQGSWHTALTAGHALLALKGMPDFFANSASIPRGRVLGLLMKDALENHFASRPDHLRGYYGAAHPHTPLEMWEQKVVGAEHVLDLVEGAATAPNAPKWAGEQLKQLRAAIEDLKSQRPLFARIEDALPGVKAQADSHMSAAQLLDSWLRKEGGKDLPPPKPEQKPTPMADAAQKLEALAADTKPQQKPAPAAGSEPKTPTSKGGKAKPSELFEKYGLQETQASLHEGRVDPEKLLSAFDAFVAKKEEVLADLNKLTKDQLIRISGNRWNADLKKERQVSAVWNRLLGIFNPSEVMTWSPTEETIEAAVRRKIAATKPADIAAYAAKVKARTAEHEGRLAGLRDPKTLEDFQNLIPLIGGEAKLKPEQRRAYDALVADEARSKALAEHTKKHEAQEAFRRLGAEASVANTSAKVIAGKHTKKGHDIFTVQLADRVSSDDFRALQAKAKGLGGYYSSFKGNGAVPGFIFEKPENAHTFASAVGGGETAAPAPDAQAPAQAETPIPPLHGTAPQRLREQADNAAARADDSLGADRKVNTARRAEMAAGAEGSARKEKAMAETMRAIADAQESGDAKHLWGVSTRAHVALLEEALQQAKFRRIREEGRASDQEA